MAKSADVLELLPEYQITNSEYPLIIYSSLLFTIYSIIYIKLWKELNRLENLDHERAQILRQSFAFSITFLFTIISFFCGYFLEERGDKQVLGVLITSLFSFLEKTIAFTCVMICHYKAFSRQLELELRYTIIEAR